MKASTDMKEYLDKPLIVWSIETKPSKFGNIMLAEVSDTETSDHFKMFIRGMKVQERLEWIVTNSELPVTATFVKIGANYEIA